MEIIKNQKRQVYRVVSFAKIYTKKAVFKLALIAVVMLPRSVGICSIAAAFERKAGRVYLQSPNVSLQIFLM